MGATFEGVQLGGEASALAAQCRTPYLLGICVLGPPLIRSAFCSSNSPVVLAASLLSPLPLPTRNAL